MLLAFAEIGRAQNVMVVNPTSKPVPVNVVAGGAAGGGAGAANLATSQVTASGTAGTVAIARPTRRQVTIKNTDAAITVYIGPATVTSGNGMPLKAGESITVRSVVLVQVIAASGSPVVAVMDEYD